MTWLHKLTRKKTIDGIPLDTSLRRCLGTLDLTLLGIGAMVGSGIYIMTGVAAKELAGKFFTTIATLIFIHRYQLHLGFNIFMGRV